MLHITENDLTTLSALQIKAKENSITEVINQYNLKFDDAEISNDPSWSLEVYWQEIEEFLTSENAYTKIKEVLK